MLIGPDFPRVIAAIEQVVGAAPRPVALHEPVMNGRVRQYIEECLETNLVSSVGPFVERFERELETLTGARRVVVTVNGTAALHVCMMLAGVQPGDEVLLPALSFVALANAVTYCGGVPHFVDSDETTLGVCPERLRHHARDIGRMQSGTLYNRRTGRPMRVLAVMHTFGHPVQLDAIAEVCREFHLVLVEDCAQAIGSLYRGKHVGRWGHVSALSFNGNKTITTGGGGAVLTGDPKLGERAKHLITQAKLPHPWELRHDDIGFNYRLPNINAAIGCAQLEILSELLDRKRSLAEAYRQAFEGIHGVRFFGEPPGAHSNYWLNALLLDQADTRTRDSLLESTHARKILTRPAWNLMPTLPMYKDNPSAAITTATTLVDRLINLPSSPQLFPAFPITPAHSDSRGRADRS